MASGVESAVSSGERGDAGTVRDAAPGVSASSPIASAVPPSSALLRTPRLWPAWTILILLIAAWVVSVTPSINNGLRFGFMMLGPTAGMLLFAAWIFAFSRLPWRERFGVAGCGLLLAIATGVASDRSMLVPIWIYGLPLAMAAVTVSLRWWSSQPTGTRLPRTAIVIAASLALFPLLRLDGFTGDYWPELSWRWSATSESERMTAPAQDNSAAPASSQLADWTPSAVEWPGFRGPAGDSRVAKFAGPLDWSKSKPREAWRTAIGPGWSSFAVVSGRLFTQEQLGEEERISCYDAATGNELWHYGSPTRFSDNVAGAGPRATPTYHDGKLYAFGAKALLTCVDAVAGQRVWERDLLAELGATIPVWGCSSSPIWVDGKVVLYVGGRDGHGWVAFDAETGETRWKIDGSGMNFSSAQRVELAGKELLICNDTEGVVAIEPASGAVAWRFKPSIWSGMIMCQSQQLDDSSLLVPLGDGAGVARPDVQFDGERWTIEERWASRQLKPSFNDFVYYDGHCYGFDQHIFACIDATTGERRWKQGRYGFGQTLLLADAGQLLITTESGELVLLAADPSGHRELGRVAAVRGKTWNHAVAVDTRIYVRNGEEMVAFEVE